MKEGITMIMTELVIESQGTGGWEPAGGEGIRGGKGGEAGLISL